MSTSQNGYPALDGRVTGPLPRLRVWRIPGTGRHLALRDGSTGFLLVHLAMWFDRKVEDIDAGVWDEWGYAFRPVRGYVALSNHASGTAMDLNATQHPLGRADTFSPAEEKLILSRVNGFYAGCIRWGGEYRGRPDEMHFEIDRGIGACERKARALLDSPRGRKILAANPGARKVIES
ncbi:M15 family metallopeptidase [Nocardioides kongjuensis]|uniref:Peptidase M15C domain-containing protein n=1 Tax=Nocardioides kongjuensis TaxID=349522 RepID=A0A852RSV7_9ACTN|nr:hypothetical protein [Nocardioides kongjuensis]